MPKDCTFCDVGVSTRCAESKCDNPICPRHTTEDGRCLDPNGLIDHTPKAEESDEKPKRQRKAAKAAAKPEPSDDEAAKTDETESSEASAETSEPATNEPD